MRLSVLVPLASLVVSASACPPPEVPGPQDAAAYLGLAVGSTATFAAGDVAATLETKQSSVLRDDALVFDLIAKESGFVKDDRTFTLAVGVDSTALVRFFDCISRCGQPSADIPFLNIPLRTGDSSETAVEVAVSENGIDAGVVAETHTLIVGDEAEVTVPAGTFTGFTVSWSRVRDGASQTSLLTIVPDTGIVAWQTFDGADLQRE